MINGQKSGPAPSRRLGPAAGARTDWDRSNTKGPVVLHHRQPAVKVQPAPDEQPRLVQPGVLHRRRVQPGSWSKASATAGRSPPRWCEGGAAPTGCARRHGLRPPGAASAARADKRHRAGTRRWYPPARRSRRPLIAHAPETSAIAIRWCQSRPAALPVEGCRVDGAAVARGAASENRRTPRDRSARLVANHVARRGMVHQMTGASSLLSRRGRGRWRPVGI